MTAMRPSPPIDAYFPRTLLRRLLQAEEASGQSRVEIDAVSLVVDLVDSTGLTDRFDASGARGTEELGELLCAYFAEVVDRIEAHGGEVIRIDGDAVLAVWPTERGTRVAALAACACAISVRALLENVGPTEVAHLAHRIALGRGRLVVAGLGAPATRRLLLVCGEAVRIMASDAQRGEPGEILLSPGAAALVSDRISIEYVRHGAFRLGTWREDRTSPPFRPRSPGPTLGPAAHDFVPSVVMERLAASHRAWLAEFRSLTMAFVKLNDLNPDTGEATSQIRAAFDVVADVAGAMGGAVWEVLDDEKGVILKLAFGLPPHTSENCAVNALEAAERVHLALRRLGIGCAIGVASGRAFCCEVGGASRRAYASNGPVMNYGARLMQAAAEGVLCDAATSRLSGVAHRLGAEEILQIKGRSAPLGVHRLIDAPEPPTITREPTRNRTLFGRDEDCADIEARLDDLPTVGARSLLITGEPGVGKSLLLGHAGAEARARGLVVVLAAAMANEANTPFFAFRQVLITLAADRSFADRLAGDPESQRLSLLEDITPTSAQAVATPADLTGAARRAALTRLVTRIFEKAGPLVLIIDDVQWLDSAATQLLAAVARRAPRVLAVMAGRPSGAAAMGAFAKLRLETLAERRLGRLDARAIAMIARERLGVATLPARLEAFIQRSAEGLPLHAEQLVLSLMESGSVSIVAGRCRVAEQGLSSQAAPDSLRSLIVGRIDRLGAVEHVTAKVASVIGSTFDHDLLAGIHPIPLSQTRLDLALDRLVDGDILARQGERRFAFRHALIRETTYELTAFAQRRPLHRKIAEAIEAGSTGPLSPHLAELAKHWEGAGEAERAIEYRCRAAELALERCASEDALDQVRAVERLAREARLELHVKRRLILARLRGDALQELSRFKDAEAQYSICATLAGVSVPRTQLGMVVGLGVEVGRHLCSRLGWARPWRDSARAERYRLIAQINIRRSERALFENDAIALMYGTLASLNQAERSSLTWAIIAGYGGVAVGLGVAGLPGLASAYARRAVALGRLRGGPRDQGLSELFGAAATLAAGNFAETTGYCERGGDIFAGTGDEFRRQTCEVLLAFVRLAAGRRDEARSIILALGADSQDVEAVAVRAWVAACLGALDAIDGEEPGPALERLEAALDEPLSTGDRLLCLGPKAAHLLTAGDPDAARRTAAEALAIMRRTPPTLASGFYSIPTIVEVLAALAARAEGSDRETLLSQAKAACKVTDAYAGKTRIARPRALLAAGRVALVSGRPAKAAALWRRGRREAKRIGMPLEAQLCRDRLLEMSGQVGIEASL